MNNVITMRFSISCPIVICSLTVCYVFEREASSENYGPGVYFYHNTKTKFLCYICLMLRLMYLSCLISTYAGQQREWPPFSAEVSFIPRLVLPPSFHNVVHIDLGLDTS